ncbi:uncharacterized protein ppp1r18 [Xiphias gladius]|uniref:uncharacterized protein ppp1r18 n=1 Tax=Xiphias gladius TaxID=8245 RepID=UPI001A98CAF4|nr:uncharacterized protein ppp1r18 [Xiphias gladius]
MKMDLREILAGGGSVTEIRASEVLIIKPSVNPEERNTGGKGREDGEMKCSMDVRRESVSRELRTDVSWLREKEKEPTKERERPRGQATVIKEDRKDSLDDNVFVERGGRVSQLLSKFGELPKPPSRSKSSDNVLRPGRRKYSGDEDDQQSEERKADWRKIKGAPKRSLSFSDRVICATENGLDDERSYERKMRERIHSDKSVAPLVDIRGLGKETTTKIKMGWTRLLDKDRFGRHRDGPVKNEDEKGGPMQRRNEAEMCISVQHRSERSDVKKVEPVDKRAAEKADDADGDEGFTVASVKNTEGISFARRVPIRQDGKARAEREVKRLAGEKSLERELSVEEDSEAGGQIEAQVSDKKVLDFLREDGIESQLIPPETLQDYVMAASAYTASPCLAESHDRHEPDVAECSSLLCTVTDRARDPHRGPEWSGTGPQGPYLTHSVLSQHTEDLISKIEKIGDTTVYSNEKGERVYKAAHEECKQEGQHYSDVESETLIQDLTPRSPKRITPMGTPPAPLEIQIPRTVFYVAEEMVERTKAVGQSDNGQDWEGGKGVERRDSWRIGKPLSRVESLREKIRQRELERLRQRETQEGDGSEAAGINDTHTAGDRFDERGNEIEQEWEAAAHMRKRLVEAERGQEDTAEQTSMAAFDVMQEVNVLKTCPQLPVSVPPSQAVRGEEVTSGYATAASEVTSDSSQISEDEDDPLKHVEEQLRRHRSRHESREEESEEEGKELSEEEVEEYISPLDPARSLSPSPPHPNSLTVMNRIYNLETVGSRSGLCLRERTVDISSVHLVKVKPLISNAQQGDSHALTGEDIGGVQTIQEQIEQFQLKEQEVLKSCTAQNFCLKDRETKRQQSPRGVLKHQVKDDAKTKEKDQSESNYKMSPQQVCSPTFQLKKTIIVNPSFLRSQSPDNSLKPFDCTPTPASSPSSPSPAQSPSVSPSPTPSPPLFSIRSASGGQVKRGATITINPKRHATGGGGGGTTGSNKGSTSAGSAPTKTPSQQAKITPALAEPTKKRYPTVEEIEVIGGYQNLERSCLVKNRVTPKRVKVCFDEDQLEQVCEYPSETSILACTLFPHDHGRLERLQGEEAQQAEAEAEAEAEGGTILSKSTRNVGTATGRSLRVDESCPRSSSPKLPM